MKNKKKRRKMYSQEVIDCIRRDQQYWILWFLREALRKNRFLVMHVRSSGDITTHCPYPHHWSHRNDQQECTPSFRIHRSKKDGIYFAKCFGCGRVGSIIELTMKYYDISFREAIRLCLQLKPVTISVSPEQLSIEFKK